uniref:OCEL domain-containing protein n=1 Tax=Glossina brevipalpis TaxID=37001 RepID=A0A1A9WSR8_9MUSC
MTNSISSAKCPSVLTSGKYGMCQHRSIVDNSKEYIFVKLTDSAFRAIEEYQRNLQSKRLSQAQCAKIQFIGNAGVIHFPTADGGSGPADGRKFGFAIDDVEGSLECIQQTGSELDVLGALNYRMRIHANDDVYDTTRTKMAIAEETEKSKCIREIKPNQTDIGRKVKRPVSAASLQAYANGLNSGNNIGINNGNNSNNNVSYLGVNNNHSNTNSNSRNKLTSLNNHSPPFNGNGSGGSSSFSASNVSSRLGSTVNSRSSPNPIMMGGSGTTCNNNRYGSPSNLSSSSSSTSCLPSLMTSASSLSSTLAGGITTGYQSASCGNSPPSMAAVTGLQKTSKAGGVNSGRGSLLSTKSSSNKGSGSSSGSNNKLPDVSRRKIRERLIHLLALKPFKKPELYARLQNEGLAQRERQLITNILKDISTLSRDNTYNLRRSLWNDVDENWPYFTEQELQQLKRRKPQNLTPPMSSDAGSSTSGQSPTSSTHTGSPPPLVAGGPVVGCGLKRASLEPDLYDGALLSGVQPKKQRISHYKKDILGAGFTTSASGVRMSGGAYQHQNRNSLAYSPPSYNGGASNGSINNHVQMNDENSGNSDLSFNVLNTVDDFMGHASIGYGGGGGDQQQSTPVRGNGNSSKTSVNNKFMPTTKSINSGSLKEKRNSACNSNRESTTAIGMRRTNNSPTPYVNNFVPESKSNSNDGNNSRPYVSQPPVHQNLHKSTSSNSVFGHNNSQHEDTVNNHSRHHSSGRDFSKHSKSASVVQGQSPPKQCNGNSSNKYQHNNYQQQQQQQQQSLMLSYANQHPVDTPPQAAQCTIVNNNPFLNYRQPQHSSPTQQQIDAAADPFSMTTSSTTDALRYDFSNYTPITSIEQRRQYKTEFESDYDEYRKLLAEVDSVAQRFREMAERLKKVRQGCQDYYKIKNQILNEYHRVRNEEAINRDKQRFDYLHEKLAHIKQLVMDYDKKLTSGAIPPPVPPIQSQQMMTTTTGQHVMVAANHSQQQVANVPAPTPISTQITTGGDTVITTLSPILKSGDNCNHSPLLATTVHKQKGSHRTHNRHHQQQQQQMHQQQHGQQQQQQQQHHEPETIRIEQQLSLPTTPDHYGNSSNQNTGELQNKLTQLPQSHQQQQQNNDSDSDSDDSSSSSSSNDGTDDDDDDDEDNSDDDGTDDDDSNSNSNDDDEDNDNEHNVCY